MSPHKQKNMLFIGMDHFKGGGEISPPLGPWCKD